MQIGILVPGEQFERHTIRPSALNIGTLFKYDNKLYVLTCRHVTTDLDQPYMAIMPSGGINRDAIPMTPVYNTIPDRNRDITAFTIPYTEQHDYLAYELSDPIFSSKGLFDSHTGTYYDTNGKIKHGNLSIPPHPNHKYIDASGTAWHMSSYAILSSKEALGCSGTLVWAADGIIGMIVACSIPVNKDKGTPFVVPITREDILSCL